MCHRPRPYWSQSFGIDTTFDSYPLHRYHYLHMAKANGSSTNLRLRNLPDSKLLSLRLCDLHLDLKSSDIAAELDQLNAELKSHNLRFHPHAWFSDEWFTPDHVPGIAIPFYLAHPRLRSEEHT